MTWAGEERSRCFWEGASAYVVSGGPDRRMHMVVEDGPL